MGIETEYGISVPSDPLANPMVTSSQVVNGYASGEPGYRRARWDFEEENPLRDARGFEVPREGADPSQLTDEDVALANVILTNGARLYVDHAHPEYSSPEVSNAHDAVLWDKAGERVMAIAARRARQLPGSPGLNLYKNNTDNKGASYGTHENYLMGRSDSLPGDRRAPDAVLRDPTDHVRARARRARASKVSEPGFQISQRADFFEVEVGLETTLKRPIINTRDEPHADAEKYRRLHVIVGDANLSEVAGLLKVGTTSIVLSMIEDGFLDQSGLGVERPVAELHAVSHDIDFAHRMMLKDGRSIGALELQGEYLELARKYIEDRYGVDTDPPTRDVLERWEEVLTGLATAPTQSGEHARLGGQAPAARGLP